MAVVINELIVTATAATDPAARRANDGGPQEKPPDKREIIEECVEEVLRVLHEKASR